MPANKLPVWITLGSALSAPFNLSLSSWKALAGPLLALAGTVLLAFLTTYLGWSEISRIAAALGVLAAAAWLTLEFQRHLLLGAVARGAGFRPWRRYGLYVLALVLLALLLGVLSGILLTFALPAMAFVLMALNSPAPWLAAGSVFLGVLAFAMAAYAPARLALILPALAVDHAAGASRSWRLSRGNGLRLLALLGIVTVLQQVLEMAMPTNGVVLAKVIAGALLASYLTLVDMAILALAYRALTDQTLPVVTPDDGRPWPVLGARIAAPLSLIAVMGLGGAVLWHAVPRTEPGGEPLITALVQPQGVESKDVEKPKLPLIESTEPVRAGATFSTMGDGPFLTVHKKRLWLRYGIDWQVSNAKRFVQAGGSNAEGIKDRIDVMAQRILRDEIGKLRPEKLRHLVDTGGTELRVETEPQPSALFGDVLEDFNARAKDYGIEITLWRIEVVKRN